ncbi:MAG: S1 RNA-binding domain-containing protein [Butyricicoccaceae bacterium]
MELAVGEILSGKVTGITKFGAFVALPEGKNGMVHISEIAPTYVDDIREHLQEGQEIRVKVIAVDQNGRINLSIKKAFPDAGQSRSGGRTGRFSAGGSANRGQNGGRRRPPQRQSAAREPEAPLSFEDKLKHFMQDSESRMSDIRHNMDRKNGSRRRK